MLMEKGGYCIYEYKPLGPSLARILTNASIVFYALKSKEKKYKPGLKAIQKWVDLVTYMYAIQLIWFWLEPIIFQK